jgi:hypothetical protein
VLPDASCILMQGARVVSFVLLALVIKQSVSFLFEKLGESRKKAI